MPNKPSYQSRLSLYFTLLTFLIIFLFIVLATIIYLLYQNQINLADSRNEYYKTYLLADELRQSSDDLTRMARSYVDTGNPKFEKEYWAIVDIRNGKLPRPQDYNRIYWDFVSAGIDKPRPDGITTSMQELIASAGLTAEETGLLSKAEFKSNELVKIENVAMHAIKGLFADPQGNFIVESKPNPEMARDLMNNADYHLKKAEVMKPIDDFYTASNERTQSHVNEHLAKQLVLFRYAGILSIIIFTALAFAYIFIINQIRRREFAENEGKVLNLVLEKKVAERTQELEQSKANLEKSLQETKEINKFMIGRELKMLELKKEIKRLETNRLPEE